MCCTRPFWAQPESSWKPDVVPVYQQRRCISWSIHRVETQHRSSSQGRWCSLVTIHPSLCLSELPLLFLPTRTCPLTFSVLFFFDIFKHRNSKMKIYPQGTHFVFARKQIQAGGLDPWCQWSVDGSWRGGRRVYLKWLRWWSSAEVFQWAKQRVQ